MPQKQPWLLLIVLLAAVLFAQIVVAENTPSTGGVGDAETGSMEGEGEGEGETTDQEPGDDGGHDGGDDSGSDTDSGTDSGTDTGSDTTTTDGGTTQH